MTLTWTKQANPARILFCVSRDDLYRLRVIRDDLDHIIRVLLRLYEGVFTDFRPIDENGNSDLERLYARKGARTC